MRPWLVMLSGLLIWTAHFFGGYGAASLFPGTVLARLLTGLITLLALAAVALLARPILRRTRAKEGGDLSQWMDGIALLGLALAAVAIFYQGLPALTA